MKLNKSGFSLIELLIAFTAVTLLSFAIFRTVISIQRRQQINIVYNDYVVFESQINFELQKDFTNKIIEAIQYCGTNCYQIKYVGEPTKTLSINRNDNTLTYGVLKLKLPKTFTFYRDIEQKDETFTVLDENKHNSITMFRIPIDSTLLDQNLDIIYIYQFDDRVNPVRSSI